MPARSEGAGRLVFLHGFTQTHHHWHPVAHRIGAGLARGGPPPTLTFADLPGHGLSSDDRGDLATTVGALGSMCGHGTYVGYSMGGRHALLAAAGGAPEIERLILIGATGGLVTAAERADRVTADERLARHIETIGVRPFLEEWTALPLFAGLPDDPVGLERRAANSTAGLAHSLRSAGTGSQPQVWDALSSVTIPVLVIAGGLDPKFTAIGHRLVDALPNATFALIDGAGHAAHTHRPTFVAATVVDWLSRTPDRC